MPSWQMCPASRAIGSTGYGQFGAGTYVVIDTGGLVIENPSVIESQMRIQTERAVAEADRLGVHRRCARGTDAAG